MAAKSRGNGLGIEEVHKYAWDWFSYHANQRLTMFRFFLILLGVIVISYSNCLMAAACFLPIVIAVFGALVSVIFLCLEFRNEQLVNVGRNALQSIEERFDCDTLGESIRLLHCDNGGSKWLKHGFLMKAFLIACIVLFVLAAAFPLGWWLSTRSDNDPSGMVEPSADSNTTSISKGCAPSSNGIVVLRRDHAWVVG